MISSWFSEVFYRRSASGLLCCLTGGLAIALGGALAWHGWHAAKTQRLYYALKYGYATGWDLDRRERLAREADQCYPHQYYLNLLMAGAHWKSRHTGSPETRAERIEAAARWCRRGVSRNPYRRELRWIEVLLAARESRTDALARWRDYVDFAFWDPWNLTTLALLAADAGEVEEALGILPLLRGKPGYPEALAAVASASGRSGQSAQSTRMPAIP